jgi:uncharacterized damage-inducible protein DinB
MEQESWLSGELENVSPMLMPAAHALVQARRDIERATENLTEPEVWTKPNGAPSVGFHLLHVAGSCDRLLTYARGENLSEKQFVSLAAENAIDDSASVALLTRKAVEEIEKVIAQIRSTPENALFEKRFVGRRKLSTNVFGLLFHIAEHTQRHAGQIITTAKIVSPCD